MQKIAGIMIGILSVLGALLVGLLVNNRVSGGSFTFSYGDKPLIQWGRE